jgi:hypothetical protein
MTFSFFQRVSKADLGEVVILNADNNTVDTPFDDLETLPMDVVRNPRTIETNFAPTFVYFAGVFIEAEVAKSSNVAR